MLRLSSLLRTAAVLAGLTGLLSCSPTLEIEVDNTPSPTPQVVLTLYHTPTTVPATPFPTLVPEIPATPVPTPTPVTYTILRGDTLGGIALRLGVELPDLLAANPGIDPQFLRVGDALVVPQPGDIPLLIPTPTPYPLPAAGPVCYRQGDGGLWCVLTVTNDRPEGVESLAGWIGLYDASGRQVQARTALPPLNLLLPGQVAPLTASFEPPLPEHVQVRGGVLTLLPVGAADDRYLPAAVEGQNIHLEEGGRQATIVGRVSLPEGAEPAVVWMAAVLYGPQGEVVGMRKWDLGRVCPLRVTSAETGKEVLAPACLFFELPVYSQGPEIRRVEILVEARP
jgi:LysM repeat protein